jgi:Tfp pilus assembly protein PilV
MLTRYAPRSRQRGMALIEVLAPMLITAFGLTAISLLLVATMQYGKIAQFQTTAQQLAASSGASPFFSLTAETGTALPADGRKPIYAV